MITNDEEWGGTSLVTERSAERLRDLKGKSDPEPMIKGRWDNLCSNDNAVL
jgi:hypothetical protein